MAIGTFCVRKVTVEYVIRKRVFAVDFTPMEVGSIFFSEKDKDAAQQKQNERARAGGRGVKAVKIRLFNPLKTLPQKNATTKLSGATSRETARTATEPKGPSLWWHANNCAWFHPDES